MQHRCCPPLPAGMQHWVSRPSPARHGALAWSWPPWGTRAGGRLPAGLCLLERTVRTCPPSCSLAEPHPGGLAPDSPWDTLSTCICPSVLTVPQTPQLQKAQKRGARSPQKGPARCVATAQQEHGGCSKDTAVPRQREPHGPSSSAPAKLSWHTWLWPPSPSARPHTCRGCCTRAVCPSAANTT